MIDPTIETIISLSAAARMLGATPRTVQRWAMDAKRRNRLESCIIGRTRRTSEEAVRRFVARSTAENFLTKGMEAEAAEALRGAGLALEAIGLPGGDNFPTAGGVTSPRENVSQSEVDRRLDEAGF